MTWMQHLSMLGFTAVFLVGTMLGLGVALFQMARQLP